MSLFICKTFSPEIFWTALAALGTLLAVCTALFAPWMEKRRELLNMKRMIEFEIQENKKGLDRIKSTKDQKLPNGEIVSAGNQINAIAISAFTLSAWEEYKYKIALKDPKFLKRHEEFNNNIFRLINFESTITRPMSSKEDREIASLAATIRKDIVNKMLEKINFR